MGLNRAFPFWQIYFITRVSTLVAVILNLLGMNVSTEINCQLWITSNITFAYLAFVTASLLIVLRVIAIWNKHRVVAAISFGIWGTNIAFLIQGIARLRSSWVPEGKMCNITNSESSKLNIIVTFITDITLLIIMLAGLLRLRRYGVGTFGLGRVLWNQGVIWLFLATIAELTPAVFISLNLNEAFNLMLLDPSLAIMSIAATRMYRSLAEFAAFESTDVFISQHISPKTSDRTVSRSMGTPQAPIPLTQIEVVTHTDEQYPASPKIRPRLD